MRVLFFLGLSLFGCQSDLAPLEDLTLEVTSPEYGVFLGDEAIVVAGRVSDPTAVVRIEGERVDVLADGTFQTTLDVEGAYRNVDVYATRENDMLRERIPVFSGNDPMDSWPSAMTARITPDGFNRMGQALGQSIDDTGWAEQLASAIPAVDTSLVYIGVVGVSHDPTEVILRPLDGGIDVGIQLNQVTIDAVAEFELFGSTTTVPVSIGYELIELGATAVPAINDEGIITLEMSDTFIIFDEPIIEALGVNLEILDFLLDGINLLIEPVGEWLLDQVFGILGTIELGGPISMETDLLGQPVNIELSEVYSEVPGLGLGIGVGLGVDAPGAPLPMWSPVESGNVSDETHLLLALHEGLIQGMIGGQLSTLLADGFEIPPAMGGMIGTAAQSLPGGASAPYADDWCIDVDAGSAMVYRHREGIAPMGAVYLPDVKVSLGPKVSGVCEQWLDTSLTLEVGLVVSDGSVVNVDISIPDGAVLAYGTTEAWSEAAVVEALASLVETMMGLLGGSLSFDLQELLGDLGSDDSLLSLVGELEPKVLWNEPAVTNNGEFPEGTYMLSMSLWPTE